jgi:hypothetical protein
MEVAEEKEQKAGTDRVLVLIVLLYTPSLNGMDCEPLP